MCPRAVSLGLDPEAGTTSKSNSRDSRKVEIPSPLLTSCPTLKTLFSNLTRLKQKLIVTDHSNDPQFMDLVSIIKNKEQPDLTQGVDRLDSMALWAVINRFISVEDYAQFSYLLSLHKAYTITAYEKIQVFNPDGTLNPDAPERNVYHYFRLAFMQYRTEVDLVECCKSEEEFVEIGTKLLRRLLEELGIKELSVIELSVGREYFATSIEENDFFEQGGQFETDQNKIAINPVDSQFVLAGVEPIIRIGFTPKSFIHKDFGRRHARVVALEPHSLKGQLGYYRQVHDMPLKDSGRPKSMVVTHDISHAAIVATFREEVSSIIRSLLDRLLVWQDLSILLNRRYFYGVIDAGVVCYTDDLGVASCQEELSIRLTRFIDSRTGKVQIIRTQRQVHSNFIELYFILIDVLMQPKFGENKLGVSVEKFFQDYLYKKDGLFQGIKQAGRAAKRKLVPRKLAPYIIAQSLLKSFPDDFTESFAKEVKTFSNLSPKEDERVVYYTSNRSVASFEITTFSSGTGREQERNTELPPPRGTTGNFS